MRSPGMAAQSRTRTARDCMNARATAIVVTNRFASNPKRARPSTFLDVESRTSLDLSMSRVATIADAAPMTSRPPLAKT